MERTLEQRVRQQNWIERHSRAFPLVVFALSIVSVIAGASVAESTERASLRQSLASQAVEFKQAILRQEAAYDANLQVGELLLSKVEVTQETFREFVFAASRSVDLLGARGIGWATVMPDRSDSRIEQVNIAFLSPDSAPNRAAIGFNMYGEKNRRMAMDQAIRAEQPVTTAPVVLIQDARLTAKPGFIIYKRVGGNGSLPKGFVYVAFQGERFLHNQLESLPRQPDYAAIYDVGDGRRTLLAATSAANGKLSTHSIRLNFGNRPWEVVVGDAPPAMLSPITTALILFGLILSGLLLYISRLVVKATIRDRAAYEWQTEQLQIRKTLNRELNHRVKNTLANVLSILSLTKRRFQTVDQFADSLAGRIRALSATHSLLTQSEWSNASIREVFEAELAPYLGGTDSGPFVTIEGPQLELAPNTALSLGLAIHEVATNASKYGALTTAEGSVHATWRISGERRARITWIETGGPTVVAPERRGFGLELLETIVAHELSEPVMVEFNSEGLRCELTVPFERQ